MRYPKLVKFLENEFAKYRIKQNGWRTSQADFARKVGITQQAMSKLMLGDTMPRLETIIKMAEALGPEVFDVCGYPRLAPKGKDINFIIENFPKLNKDEQGRVMDTMQEMIERKKSHNFKANNAEA